jgi:hypothetical protein
MAHRVDGARSLDTRTAARMAGYACASFWRSNWQGSIALPKRFDLGAVEPHNGGRQLLSGRRAVLQCGTH